MEVLVLRGRGWLEGRVSRDPGWRREMLALREAWRLLETLALREPGPLLEVLALREAGQRLEVFDRPAPRDHPQPAA